MEDQDRPEETRNDEEVEGHGNVANVGKDDEPEDDVEAHSPFHPSPGVPVPGVPAADEGDDVEAHSPFHPVPGVPSPGVPAADEDDDVEAHMNVGRPQHPRPQTP
jgi:hypothetical protein